MDKADIAVPFGAAVLCPVASATHSSEQKQELGVCMGPSTNTRGGVRVYTRYILHRRAPVIRRTFKQLRMQQHIIDHMNSYASETGTSTQNNNPETETEGDINNDPVYYVDTMANDIEDRSEDYNRGQEAQHLTFKPTLVKFVYSDGDMKVKEKTDTKPSQPSATQSEESSTPNHQAEVPDKSSPNNHVLPPNNTSTGASTNRRSPATSWTTMSEDNIIDGKRTRKPNAKLFQMTLKKALKSEAARSSNPKQAMQQEVQP